MASACALGALALVACAALPLGADGVTGRVEGVIVDQDQTPIGGAAVTLFWLTVNPQGGFHSLEDWQTVSDPEGRFVLPELAKPYLPGRFLLYCRRSGYVSYPPDHYMGGREDSQSPSPPPAPLLRRGGDAAERAFGIFSLAPGQIAAREIVLQEGGRIQGQLLVRTPEGITPAARHVRPALFKNPEPSESFLPRAGLYVAGVALDEEGRFDVPDLPDSNEYYLFLSTGGYPSSRIEAIGVRRGEVTRIERTLDFTDVTGVTGTVRISGQPADSGWMYIRATPFPESPEVSYEHGCDTNVTSDGSFSCRGVRPGRYTLSLMASRGRTQVHYETTVVIDSAATTPLELDLPIPTEPPSQP